MDRLTLTERLILVIVPLGILHHVDHVLRADHAGWPFRPEVRIFTVTLVIYPLLALAYAMRSRPWVRTGIISTVAFFTVFAHTLIELPGQIYGTWAHNLSMDALLYTVDPEHQHNLLDGEFPVVGGVATGVSTVLTGLLVVAAIVAVRDARRDKTGMRCRRGWGMPSIGSRSRTRQRSPSWSRRWQRGCGGTSACC